MGYYIRHRAGGHPVGFSGPYASLKEAHYERDIRAQKFPFNNYIVVWSNDEQERHNLGIVVQAPITDKFTKPAHYVRLSPEPLDVITAWGLPYPRSAAIKYIARAGHKDSEVDDLKKAIAYLEYEVRKLEKTSAS